ncbi:helix-turn-helix transcriptional regulator [Longispora sp. NPDC051575]|uniref:helix-turn-helix domain-containing protein n=1 Tax=Longispora sp. NPDC051575 TaxID=3154943 RepID=UPI003438704E
MPELEHLDRRRRQLAEVLRDLRRAAGLSGARLAARTGMSQSKISKIETGRIRPAVADVERIVVALGVPDDARRPIIELARNANLSFITVRAIRQAGLHVRQRVIAGIEDQAREIRCFQPAMVPGLLQIPGYVRAVLSLPTVAGATDPAPAVLARLERQAILHAPGRRFWFLVTEAALRTRLCADSVMAVQIEHIVALSRLVDVSVLPLAGRMPEIPTTAFVLFDRRLVTVETFHGELEMRDPKDIGLYAEIYTLLDRVALHADAARDFLSGLAAEYRDGGITAD